MIVFVSDVFAEDYVGGAELTTEGILQGTDLPVIKIRSQQLNHQIIDAPFDRDWETNTINLTKVLLFH